MFLPWAKLINCNTKSLDVCALVLRLRRSFPQWETYKNLCIPVLCIKLMVPRGAVYQLGVGNTTDKLSPHIRPRMCAEYRHFGSETQKCANENVFTISHLREYNSQCCRSSYCAAIARLNIAVFFWIKAYFFIERERSLLNYELLSNLSKPYYFL